MSLTELIAGVEAHETTLTVYNAEEAVTDLRERFADRNLTVEVGTATGGPDRFAVLSRGGECVSATGIEALLADPDAEQAGFQSDPYRPILDHLDETLFTSYDRGEMLAASREIEDRAWRVGRGELHAGFQRLSTLRPQLETYRALGKHDGLTVHTYGVPDAEIRTRGAFLVHAEESEEIATSWFVAFDGDGLDGNACALLAEERLPGEFYGFWTYDPDTVRYVIDHLSATYLPTDVGDGNSEPQP
jgi:Sensory domain in DIguanylate Cyclases and Two-component system